MHDSLQKSECSEPTHFIKIVIKEPLNKSIIQKDSDN